MTEATGPAAALDFAYQWTPKEHARAQQVIFWTRLKHESLGLVLAALVVAILVADVIGIILAAQDDPRMLNVVLPVTLVVVAFLWWLFWGRGRADAWRQQRTDSSLQHPIHHIVGSGGLRVRGKTAEVALRWKAMKRVIETSDFVLFYHSRGDAYYLPRRVASAEELARLRALIRTHLGDFAELYD